MAQDPETCEYPVMPQMAIATGHVDMVLPCREMPKAIASYVLRNANIRDGGRDVTNEVK